MSDDALRLEVTCPSCGKLYRVKRELAGKSAKCACGAKLKIPAPASPETTDNEIDGLFSDDVAQVRPFDDADFDVSSNNSMEVESPTERYVPQSIRQAIAAGESSAGKSGRAAGTGGNSESSWALKFVGVFGFLIIAQTALAALVMVAAVLLYLIRPDATLVAGVVLIGVLAFQLTICFIIYRLGKGLVDGERSAVHGLTLLFVLSTVASIGMAVAFPPLIVPVLVGLAVNSAFYLAPITVAYLHWDDFHVAED
jgi:hypothetical protein